jgi:hypothetical protein
MLVQTAYAIRPASSLIINSRCVDNDFEFGGLLAIRQQLATRRELANGLVFKGKLDSLNTWFKLL